jgi:biotin carboxylase
MMMQKTILILGAGPDQLFMIRTAKKMGLKVIAFDKNINAPGFKESDEYAAISTKNLDSIFNFIDTYQNKNRKIHGVSTMGSDIPNIVARVADYLKTPSISIKSADLATNKFQMKEQFVKHQVATPQYMLIDNINDLDIAFSKFGDKLVLKPIDQAGSRGVSLITKDDDLDSLFNHAISTTNEKNILVEEFISGPQISTESLMLDGELYTPGYADRNYDDLELFRPQIMENGGWIPSLYENNRESILKEIKKSAISLGIDNSIIKGDVVLSSKGPLIIEIAARLSGGDFSESLVPLGIGVNYVKSVIELAIGQKPNLNDIKPKFNKSAANRYFFGKPGKLINIKGIEAIKSKDWVLKFEIWYKPGDYLPKISSHGQRTGVFVVVGSTRQIVQERINWVYETIKFIIDDK